jgi:hypothetical protein
MEKYLENDNIRQFAVYPCSASTLAVLTLMHSVEGISQEGSQMLHEFDLPPYAVERLYEVGVLGKRRQRCHDVGIHVVISK